MLTSAALPGRLAALDVGVACPDAAGAGVDACESMRCAKLRRYAGHLGELEREGVAYTPVTWSCYGRPRVDSERVVSALAAAAARRQGFADGGALLQRARGALGVQIRRRAACMVHSFLPRLSGEEAVQLVGQARAGAAPG